MELLVNAARENKVVPRTNGEKDEPIENHR
jgi:hypothetical protein